MENISDPNSLFVLVAAVMVMFWNAYQYFELERLRQQAITWPKRHGRLQSHRLEKVIEEDGHGPSLYYKPQFNRAYEYYEQGELRKSIYLTLGLLRLSLPKAQRLEKRFENQRDFWVRTDPDGKLPGCLTPGPELMGWYHILKAILPLIIICLVIFLDLVPSVYLWLFIALMVAMRVFTVSYQSGFLENWLEPIEDKAEIKDKLALKTLDQLKMKSLEPNPY